MAARVVVSVLLVLLFFALVILSCLVPAFGASPAHFLWGGLISPVLVSGVALFFIWSWR